MQGGAIIRLGRAYIPMPRKRTFFDIEKGPYGARELIRRMIANLQALNEREKETLRLLSLGYDAKSVARNLGISVHTVNERLRASRRKLEVSSSREAARLLASFEQRLPNSVVHEELGVPRHSDVNKYHRRNGKGAEHPLVLAIGGILIMSLIIVTAVLTWGVSGDAEVGPLPNWSVATAAPQPVSRPMNILHLDGSRLLWNGEEASEASIREFLGIIANEMNPRPLTILSYSAQTPAKRVRRARLLIDEVIRCKPARCLEIVISPA